MVKVEITVPDDVFNNPTFQKILNIDADSRGEIIRNVIQLIDILNNTDNGKEVDVQEIVNEFKEDIK